MTRILCIALILLVGCRNSTTPDVVVAEKKKTKTSDDKIVVALETFRQGGDQARYRDALNLLGPSLANEPAERLTLTAEQRTFLETEAKLTAAEMLELSANFFRPIDAAHVDAATLFRDAARALEVPGLGELDQAEFAFAWVARRVLFFEQGQEGLPPAAILRAGHGSAADRGLVFLALLHQFKIDGCLLVSPEMRDVPLVGALIQKKLYLFDTRLGRPVPSPDGKSTATWDEVLKQPDLLKNSKLSAEQTAKLEGRLAAPLESLAPRMKYLESLLQGDEAHVGGDRLAVFHDLSREALDLQAAGLTKVRVWQPSLRGVRQFETVEDGGVDQTNRAKRFTSALIPWPVVQQRYKSLRIYDELPPQALENLLGLTGELFDKYYRQPGEMLVRGKNEALPRRLDRIRTVVEEADAPNEEKELLKQSAGWRERVNQAYLALNRQEPDGGAKVNALWRDDQYLGYLMQPDLEEIPRGATKTILSRIVLTSAREPLGARANWLFASLSQDKAERAQEALLTQREAGKESKSAAANARNAWLNARSAWSKYLDRNNLGPGVYAASIPELRRQMQRGADEGNFRPVTERVITQWESMQVELHQYAAARLEQARAMKQTGQDPAPLLDPLAKELGDLQANETLAKERALIAASGLLNTPEAQRRWGLLMRDWSPDGNLAWLQETVRLARKAGE